MNRDSDLIAIPFILGLLLAMVAVLAAFLLVGAAAGIVVLIVSMSLIGYVAFRGLKGNGSK